MNAAGGVAMTYCARRTAILHRVAELVAAVDQALNEGVCVVAGASAVGSFEAQANIFVEHPGAMRKRITYHPYGQRSEHAR